MLTVDWFKQFSKSTFESPIFESPVIPPLECFTPQGLFIPPFPIEARWQRACMYARGCVHPMLWVRKLQWNNVLQYSANAVQCYRILQNSLMFCNILHYSAILWNTLQCPSIICNILQCYAGQPSSCLYVLQDIRPTVWHKTQISAKDSRNTS